MKTTIKDRKDFPECVRSFEQLKGICVGECIDETYSLHKSHGAHAHSNHNDKHYGWICVRRKYILKQKPIMLHEVAHLIVGYQKFPHGKKWKETVVKIGGTFKSFRFKSGYGTMWENIDYTYRNH